MMFGFPWYLKSSISLEHGTLSTLISIYAYMYIDTQVSMYKSTYIYIYTYGHIRTYVLMYFASDYFPESHINPASKPAHISIPRSEVYQQSAESSILGWIRASQQEGLDRTVGAAGGRGSSRKLMGCLWKGFFVKIS